MFRLLSGLSGLALVCALPSAGVAQVVLEGGGVTVRAPAALDCAALPVIALEGTIAAALAGDRAGLGDAVLRMSQGIASACPSAEALEFAGTDRDVSVTFRTRKADGWRMPGTAAATAPVAAAAPATPAAATQQAAAAPDQSQPAAAPSEPEAAPPIAPGIAFADLAAFHGGITTVRGHASLQASEVWTRVLASRAYAERPDILADDLTALEIAQQMLNPLEFQQFVGPAYQQMRRGFQGLSVFERRDLAERVRTQLAPYLDQRRQTGPIDLYHAIPIRLAEYSFERRAFPFQQAPSRNHPAPRWRGYMLTDLLNAVALPTELGASQDEARQIDDFLRTRRDQTVYLGVFITADPRAPANLSERGGQSPAPPRDVAVRQVALFFDADLTQMLFDYTPILAERQATIAALQAEFGRPHATGDSIVMAIAKVTGDTAAPGKLADAAAVMAQQYQEDPEAVRRQMQATLARTSDGARQRFATSLNVRPYDPAQGGVPVSRISFASPSFSTDYMNASVQLSVFPDLTILPVDAATGARIQEAANRSGMEVVIEGDIVHGTVLSQDNFLRVEGTVTPRRVLVFSGRGNQPVATRELLADITLPEAPSLPTAPFATFGGGN